MPDTSTIERTAEISDWGNEGKCRCEECNMPLWYWRGSPLDVSGENLCNDCIAKSWADETMEIFRKALAPPSTV